MSTFRGRQYIPLTTHVNVGKQWVLGGNGLPRDLKTTVHGRVPKDQTSCAELTVKMRVD